MDGGGGSSNAVSSYSLGGTIGQPDAGTLTGTGYSLAGGFWSALAPAGPLEIPLYLPLVKK